MHCLAERRATSPKDITIDSPHEPFHQEEATTPRGVHCPEACLAQVQRCHHRGCSEPITAECCHCLPVCHSCQPLRARATLPTVTWCQTDTGVQCPCEVPEGKGSFGYLVNLPLGSRSADPHSTAVWCGNLLHSCPRPHTAGCRSTLHLVEYALLQPRSAPEDTPTGYRPSRHSNLQCPSTRLMLCTGCHSSGRL